MYTSAQNFLKQETFQQMLNLSVSVLLSTSNVTADSNSVFSLFATRALHCGSCSKDQTGVLRNILRSHSDLCSISNTTWIAIEFLPYFRLVWTNPSFPQNSCTGYSKILDYEIAAEKAQKRNLVQPRIKLGPMMEFSSELSNPDATDVLCRYNTSIEMAFQIFRKSIKCLTCSLYYDKA